MIDNASFPLDEQVNQSYADWATRPSSVPDFIGRRAMGAIIRFQPGSLAALAAMLCLASGAGLLLLALISTSSVSPTAQTPIAIAAPR
jgi:hypothetical protein